MASSKVKRLYRSRVDRVLGGVCGGIGEYFNTDPTLIRLLWVVLTLLSLGVGILAYLIAWIIVPESPTEVPPPPTAERPAIPVSKLSEIAGVIFVVLGLVLLFHTLGLFPWNFWVVWKYYWPLVVVLIGVVLIAIGLKGRERM